MNRPREEPSTSVVVVNFNGREHMEDCFRSLREIDYPEDRLELICVDNGSSDGSVEFLRESFPSVRVVESARNAGFAGGCNLGARAASGEFLAFCNNDMRVDRGWVRGLLAPIDREAGVVCTSGRILSWDGEEIDFDRGAVTFHGIALQVGSGAPAGLVPPATGALLFACGGSMLVDREVYLDTGGFDDDFFAFFEDVDFGWRLWVEGYRTEAAPEAVCYHRVHATAGSIPPFRLRRYYERNALWTLIKNLGERNLGRVLAASVVLAARRGVMDAGIGRAVYEMWAEGDDASEQVGRLGLAAFIALDEVAERLPEVLRKRAEIQSRRKRSDAEIFRHFGRPFQPVSRVDSYLRTQAEVVRLFGVDEMFEEREAAMVLVVAECRPEFAAAWKERAASWARSLGGNFEVTLAGDGVEEQHGLRVFASDPERLERLFEYHEVVLVHAGLFALHPPPTPGPLLLVDLAGVDPGASHDWLARAIEAADAFTVPSEDDASAWKRALGAAEVIVAGTSEVAPLHEICRNPDRTWAARGRRRLDRFTYEVEVLIDNWEREVRQARRMVEERDEQLARLRGEYERALAEIERLRSHFVMRNYARVRKLIPIRREETGDG